MSLVVELESVYTLNEQIQCLCKAFFRNSAQSRILGDKNLVTKRFKNEKFIEEDEGSSFISTTNHEIKYNLGSKIKPDDILKIECFKIGKFNKK